MAATASRSLLRPGVGYQPADGHARRWDAPTSTRTVTRYHAPSHRTTRVDAPTTPRTSYHAPSSHLGTSYSAPAARRRSERDA